MGKENSEQIKRIEQEAEESAIEASYMQSDKEVFETTHWDEFNDYVKGYKAGVLSREEIIEKREKEITRLSDYIDSVIPQHDRFVKLCEYQEKKIKQLEGGLVELMDWCKEQSNLLYGSSNTHERGAMEAFNSIKEKATELLLGRLKSDEQKDKRIAELEDGIMDVLEEMKKENFISQARIKLELLIK